MGEVGEVKPNCDFLLVSPSASFNFIVWVPTCSSVGVCLNLILYPAHDDLIIPKGSSSTRPRLKELPMVEDGFVRVEQRLQQITSTQKEK